MIRLLQIGSGFPRIRSTAVLVSCDDNHILVDCGSFEERTQLVNALDQSGLSPLDIQSVCITHTHFDHIENLELFKNAKVFIHEKEMQFLEYLCALNESEIYDYVRGRYEKILDFYARAIRDRFVKHRSAYESILSNTGQMVKLSCSTQISKGVQMLSTPGHTIGHMAVGISCHNGAADVWIMGDAITSYKAWQNNQEHLCEDIRASIETRTTLQALRGIAIPGHDLPFDLVSGERSRIDSKGRLMCRLK